MSFVRFSDDNYKSDIYIFMDTLNRYNLWVADLRYKRDKYDNPIFQESELIQNRYAGAVLITNNVDIIKSFLKALKREGFRIPKYTYKNLDLKEGL